MKEDVLLVEQEGYVATLIINRPDKRNALNPDIHAGLVANIDRFAEEGEVRCLVIRGQGDLAFSAGDDLTILAKQAELGQIEPTLDPTKAPELQWPIRRSRQAIFDAPFPIIAMIRGYCLGGGLALATECDLRIATVTSKLGIPPSKLGIIYDFDRIQEFIDLVGPAFAKELFLSGRTITAQKASEIGLVNELVQEDALETTVYSLAAELSENAPLSVKGHKRVINTLTRRRIEGSALSGTDIKNMREDQIFAANSKDAKEGPLAFREKRKPIFLGR